LKILDKNLVVLNLEGNTAEDVIKYLGTIMEKEGYVKDSYINAVLQREKIYPTGLPSEGVCVAIPHIDSNHVFKSAISIGILKKPVKFHMMGNPDKELDVEIVFLLAIDNPKLQLNLLKNLMEVFQNSELLLKLKYSKEKDDIINLLGFLNCEVDTTKES
jgi:galactitol PTS system EIIA component